MDAAAQQPASDPGSITAQQALAANTQAISQTGLLPVYGMHLQVDPTWVDGSELSEPVNGIPKRHSFEVT